MTGKIKRLFGDRPYGFITGDNGEDYFFHESEIVTDASEIEIAEGQSVEFDTTRNQHDRQGRLCAVRIMVKGFVAANVKVGAL